jgi:hypothetical protein
MTNRNMTFLSKNRRHAQTYRLTYTIYEAKNNSRFVRIVFATKLTIKSGWHTKCRFRDSLEYIGIHHSELRFIIMNQDSYPK